MKTSTFLIVALALSAIGMNAQFGAHIPERQSLVIHKKMMPIFPRSLLEAGVNNGSVQILVDVDADGLLSEWLVVGYSHPEFADAVEAAVRRWEFEPMRVRGETVASQVELFFDFSSEGSVVSLIGSGVTPGSLIRELNNFRGTWPKSLQDLDRIPMPLVTVAPSYGFDLKDKGVYGQATVEFYIDKTGTVRMPAVLDSDFMELGALALRAVEQWSFEPATARGRPVLVKARQVFHFGENDL
jgi:TonB family protein